jgi:hypothetical protein
VSTPTLVEALRGGDRAALEGLLAHDVVFHSPVRTYEGRAVVLHLLATIAGVLDDIEPARVVSGARETVTFATARVGDAAADAVVDERFDDEGRVAELTLMLRPLDVLLSAVERMGRALDRRSEA